MLKRFKEKIKLWATRENVISLAISTVLTAVIFADTNVFHGRILSVLWIIIGVVVTVLIVAVLIVAGVAVVKSLIKISAGLSLLIFIAQSYCDSVRSSAADAALYALLLMGFLYLFYDFLSKLYSISNFHYENIKKADGADFKKERYVYSVAYIIFIGLYLWAIYLVLTPILAGLCIE